MRYGVIDVGSNSVRFMLSEGERTVYKVSRITKLAKGMHSCGALTAAAIGNTLAALSFFVKKAEDERVDKLYCFATSAVRTAENADEFLSAVKEVCGLDVEVVSETEEAEIGCLGALGGKDGGIIDIGGGSTEIQVVKNGTTVYSKSLPEGAVRLTDRCGQDSEMLAEYLKKRVSAFGKVPKADFIAIGGTATTASAILIGLEDYEPDRVEGYFLSSEEIKTLSFRLARMSVEERKKLKGLQPERAEVISSGVALLCALTDYIGLEGVTVSEKDNLEGYLLRKIK